MAVTNYDPTSFVEEQAIQLYSFINNTEEAVAIEILKLQLKLAYQQGYSKGLNEGYRNANSRKI